MPQNCTYVYEYDGAGNITTKKKYALTYAQEPYVLISQNTYSYANEDWDDKLTNYNGMPISYDAIGNPTLYYNGRQYSNLMWEHGRNLVYLMMGTSYVSFEYNDQGIRTSKTDTTGVTYHYVLDGTRIVAETWSDEFLYLQQKH